VGVNENKDIIRWVGYKETWISESNVTPTHPTNHCL